MLCDSAAEVLVEPRGGVDRRRTEVVWDKAVIWSDGFNHEEMLHEPEVSWQTEALTRPRLALRHTPLSENQLKL